MKTRKRKTKRKAREKNPKGYRKFKKALTDSEKLLADQILASHSGETLPISNGGTDHATDALRYVLAPTGDVSAVTPYKPKSAWQKMVKISQDATDAFLEAFLVVSVIAAWVGACFLVGWALSRLFHK